uniref:Ig-like domain-containing protein n=1 Tax=Paramormyrops kingsleyae TaxID=1676925 RepID=A0A3B3S1Z9_9TELE
TKPAALTSAPACLSPWRSGRTVLPTAVWPPTQSAKRLQRGTSNSCVLSWVNISERFRERLQLDPQTGSLSITNISTSDAGIYQLQIINGQVLKRKFNLEIYYPVNRPHITSLQASSRSSVRPSASGRCWVLCSVDNGRDVTLSWYRGTERLNQTSSPDLSTSLSLSLEVREDSPAYSCVATNPVSEEAAEGNIKQLCAELGSSLTPRMYIIPAVLIPTAVMLMVGFICLIYNTKISREIKGKNVQH